MVRIDTRPAIVVSALEVQSAQRDPLHMRCKYCTHSNVCHDCEAETETANCTTIDIWSPGMVPPTHKLTARVVAHR